MCGIAGIVNIKGEPLPQLRENLDVMSTLIEHRGPDGKGIWLNQNKSIGFAHRRLTIVDLSPSGAQPMVGPNETCLTYNGEIYNYRELQDEFSSHWTFQSKSDTETILAAYDKYQTNCLEKLRGMFSFALWDEKRKTLFCARDRLGIKPFYYTLQGNVFLFASEAKALLPFLDTIETDYDVFDEYLTFQYLLGEKTLFKGISQLLPGHFLTIKEGHLRIQKYWDLTYSPLKNSSEKFYQAGLRDCLEESLALHRRSDVPIGSYLSGGVDSSLIAVLSSKQDETMRGGFHGRFREFPGYDESFYAEAVAKDIGQPFHCIDITAEHFKENIQDILYYLDFPIAGPGAFPQYMVSGLASHYVKVIFGGQGGDELFGGYARYMLTYLEHALHGAIKGKTAAPLSLAEISPRLSMLREYTPLLKYFWSQGLFETPDHRYFRLCDRSHDFQNEIDKDFINKEKIFTKFKKIFNAEASVPDGDIFNKMLRFDLKCLLPGLLQVEDRMSMAHGLESRVPLLDHRLVEYAAQIPTAVKFRGGQMKYMLQSTFDKSIPSLIKNRRDKMGFPVPLKEFFSSSLHTFIRDILSHSIVKKRPYLKTMNPEDFVNNAGRYSRKAWALLSLELWQMSFHDRQSDFKMLLKS